MFRSPAVTQAAHPKPVLKSVPMLVRDSLPTRSWASRRILRGAPPTLSAASQTLRVSPQILRVAPPILGVSSQILRAAPPILGVAPPIRGASPQLLRVLPPIAGAASPPSSPLRSGLLPLALSPLRSRRGSAVQPLRGLPIQPLSFHTPAPAIPGGAGQPLRGLPIQPLSFQTRTRQLPVGKRGSVVGPPASWP